VAEFQPPVYFYDAPDAFRNKATRSCNSFGLYYDTVDVHIKPQGQQRQSRRRIKGCSICIIRAIFGLPLPSPPHTNCPPPNPPTATHHAFIRTHPFLLFLAMPLSTCLTTPTLVSLAWAGSHIDLCCLCSRQRMDGGASPMASLLFTPPPPPLLRFALHHPTHFAPFLTSMPLPLLLPTGPFQQ